MYSGHEPAGERIVDLSAPLHRRCRARARSKRMIRLHLRVVRHSAAHVMATAILELFPETKLGHGPATDNGFFYDVYRETPFTEADLAAIEARMARGGRARREIPARRRAARRGSADYEKSGRVHEGPLHRDASPSPAKRSRSTRTATSRTSAAARTSLPPAA